MEKPFESFGAMTTEDITVLQSQEIEMFKTLEQTSVENVAAAYELITSLLKKFFSKEYQEQSPEELASLSL